MPPPMPPPNPPTASGPSSRGGAFRAHQQHVYPQRLLCAVMHLATRIRFRPWKNWQIRWFVRRYAVDFDEAVETEAAAYPDFNTFFTRPLKPGRRVVEQAADVIACPCDGTVSQAGEIRAGTLVQAKGRDYSLAALLGGSEETASRFAGGRFATIYLSPRDYHRVHMPVDGRLEEMIHVPGRFFSVNPNTCDHVRDLFARNERVVSLFDTPVGPLAVVLVGALFVGGIEQTWSGPVTPPRRRSILRQRYGAGGAGGAGAGAAGSGPHVSLARGEEMGRFNMGSTVVLALGNPGLDWVETLRPGQPVRMGEAIGRLRAMDPANE